MEHVVFYTRYRIARKFRGVKFSQKLTRLSFCDFIFADFGPIAIINDVNILSRAGINPRKPRKFYPTKLSSYTVYRYFQKSIVCMEI